MTFDAAGDTLDIDVPIMALQAESVLCAFGDFPIQGEIVTYEECE